MTDDTSNPPTTDMPVGEVVMEPNRLQRFAINHPRGHRALAIIGGVGTFLGAALLANNLKKGQPHLDRAKDHVLEAGQEIAAATVSPQSTETPA